jgi:hypothetical protein
LDDRESARKLRLVLPNGTGDYSGLFRIRNAIDANEYHASVMKSLPIDEFTEILVFGDQNPCIPDRPFEDDVIFDALEILSDPPQVMPIATKGVDD